MDTKIIKPLVHHIVNILVILAMAFSLSTVVHAAPPSPFIGTWFSTDIDGSEVRLVIAGHAAGPFHITWTETYISFCDGRAGIIRGKGWLNEEDANLLEADLHLQCFTTGASFDFHTVWRYHMTTNTLSNAWNGYITIWSRLRKPAPPPPNLNLRVNYGDNWVESFYEAGHTAWITVFDSDQLTVKAWAELITEPKEYWNGEPGFQSMDSSWYDGDGNLLEYPPDIQPYDWVYGWVDNGATARVQIGDITGVVDLPTDSIEGTIYTPWFSSEVNVECFPWGAPEPQPEMKYDAVQPDGADPYNCSWAGEWDIGFGQTVGVGYLGPDGHWVANSFRNTYFTAFPENEYIEGFFWPLGANVHLSIDDPATEINPDFEQDQTVSVTPWDPNTTWVMYNFSGEYDLKPGDVVILSDGITTRTHTIHNLAVTHTSAMDNTVTGTTDPDTQLNVWAHEHGEYAVHPISDANGNWTADFEAVGFDLVENMCGRAELPDEFGNATAVDWCVPNPRFTIFPEWNWYDAMDWSDGVTITITVEEKPECAASGVSSGNFFNGGFPESCDIVIGDVLTFTDGETIRTHTVRNLAITDIDKTANTVSGTADPGAQLNVWVHEHGEYAVQPIAGPDGNWSADFGAVGLDLVENMCGRAAIGDEYGNSTAIDWCIPNPRFTIFPEWNWYDAMDWSDGVIVSIGVEGKPECDTSGVSSGNFFNGGFPETCDIVIGDTLTFTDGETIRTHTVRNLTITDADAAADTVTGKSDPGEHLNLVAYDSEISVQPTADEYGNWTADFGAAGLDLVVGAGGRAAIGDEYGNATSVEWIVSSKYFITSTDDVIANDGICTLREAIIAANTNSPSGNMEGECPAGLDYGTDIIILAADQTYALTIDSSYENESRDGDLDIWDNSAALDLILKVDRGGNAIIAQNATIDDRVLENWATARMEGVTFTGGTEGGIGGSILNHGFLSMDTCAVSNSTAGWSGGGIFNSGTLEGVSISIINNASAGDGGGGVANEGSMTLIGSTISGNTGSGDGGGFTNNGNLLIDSSILSGNSAPGKGGGALANLYGGMVTIQNGTETRENTAGTGGGLFNYGSMTVKDSAVADNSADFGGGISVWAGTLTVNNSTVTGNISANHGGGIHNVGSATSIIENGSLISGNTATWNGGGIDIWDNGTVTISNSTVSNNVGGGSGGGLTNENSGILTLESSTIIGNTASNDGGGIANWATLSITNSIISNNHSVWGGGMITTGGVATLDSSTISGNTADGDAGGIFIKDAAVVTIQNGSQIASNEAAWGGGISSWASTLTIDGSTISGNTAVNSGGGILVHEGGKATIQNSSLISGNSSTNGGGIANWGPTEMEINSSTVTGNTAVGEAGGGIWNSGILTVVNSNISTNSAISGGGGVFNWYGGVLTVDTSTIDTNTAGWGAGIDSFPDGVVTISDSIITDNQSENSGGGLLNWNGTLTVSGSAILNNMAIADGDAVNSSATALNGTTVTNSCIVGNGTLAVFNEQSVSQNFTLNWWGDPSGPGGFGPGSGDTVGSNIDFSGWLLTPPSICAP